MIGFFTDDAAVASAAVLLITPMIVYQYLDATQINYANCLRGTGNVRPLLWVAVLSYFVIGVPVLLLLSVGFGMGSVGVYCSFNVALLVAAILQYVAFARTVRGQQAGRLN
ncbi:MAG: MATE family efflux transporter, partial [Muribaculaceae bacterium]|nr:MATE family efflux transporter [Muribaculaceae bacterium]